MYKKKISFPNALSSEIPFEKILPLEGENTCEILSMRDQIVALLDKMNFQNIRNQNLFKQTEHLLEYSPSISHYQPMASPSIRAKRRTIVGTIDKPLR